MPLHPNVRKLWQVVALLVTVPLAIAVAVPGILLDLPTLLVAAAVLLVLLPAAVVPRLAYRRWRYAIREHDLYTSKGAIWHVETLVPFDRIQFVESRQGPLDRAFTLTQVIVYTAAGKAASIPGLDRATAETIREDLSKVAGAPSV
jgi:membrane protein YdbS with pleckstrin-like domain